MLSPLSSIWGEAIADRLWETDAAIEDVQQIQRNEKTLAASKSRHQYAFAPAVVQARLQCCMWTDKFEIAVEMGSHCFFSGSSKKCMTWALMQLIQSSYSTLARFEKNVRIFLWLDNLVQFKIGFDKTVDRWAWKLYFLELNEMQCNVVDDCESGRNSNCETFDSQLSCLANHTDGMDCQRTDCCTGACLFGSFCTVIRGDCASTSLRSAIHVASEEVLGKDHHCCG